MHAPPHLSRAAVDELEAAIAQGQIPVNDDMRIAFWPARLYLTLRG